MYLKLKGTEPTLGRCSEKTMARAAAVAGFSHGGESVRKSVLKAFLESGFSL